MDPSLHAREPLRQHGRLRTTDVSEAQEVVAQVYVPHRLDPVDGSAVRARLNAVTSGAITFGYLTYGARSQITLPLMDVCYHINVTLTGSSRVGRSGGNRDTTAGLAQAAVLTPHQPHTVEWSADAEQIALKIPRVDLEGQLAQLSNAPVTGPIDFDLTFDLRSAAGRGLLRALDFVQREWDENGVLVTHPASMRQLEAMVLTNLLVAATGSHQEALLGTQAEARPAALNQAMSYIHDHVHELPTLSDVTTAAGVSARALQLTFRRHLSCTPTEYLRDLRLRNVRAELLHPASDAVTVTEVAMRWGFYSPGRFAADYQRQFGEAPSQTLRRSGATPAGEPESVNLNSAGRPPA